MKRAILIPFCLLALTGCDRSTLRRAIDRFGSPEKVKPEVYHESVGYSPGAKKSKVEEDFNRYHYYIAPDKEEPVETDPDIYFRQDYEPIEPMPLFDEEQFWREHHFITDDTL